LQLDDIFYGWIFGFLDFHICRSRIKMVSKYADIQFSNKHTLAAAVGGVTAPPVDHQEGVGRADGETPHCGELVITRRVKEIHLEIQDSQKIQEIQRSQPIRRLCCLHPHLQSCLPEGEVFRVQVLHGGEVSGLGKDWYFI
jgi:hypothetical protein